MSLAALVLPSAALAAERYIVVVEPGASPIASAQRHGAAADRIFGHAIRGYAAVMDERAVAAARADDATVMVALDGPVTVAAKPSGGGAVAVQAIPTGVQRIGGLGAIDGVDTRVGADVAIIDTGIDPGHRDLSIAGGVNCSSGSSWADGNGHSTHVAGTVGALDNTQGVVGVAAGVRLHAVRVLDNRGNGTISSVICGIDWVTANAATIEVANMSLSGTGSDDRACGSLNNDPMHRAICASVAAGVTYVAAAGNSAVDAAGHVPAAYDEVITVSALADFNGSPGGGGAATCRSDVDDTLADFSNDGEDVDIAAPGVCIHSAWKGGGYKTISGTSMAAPHVAGAAALYRSAFAATPAEVKDALLLVTEDGPISGDTDGFAEGVLNVSTL